MKKVKKIITGFLMVFIFMAMVLPMTTVKASEEKEAVEKRMYTVTFRAGNVASFDIDKITVSDGMDVDYRITCNNGNQRTLINP